MALDIQYLKDNYFVFDLPIPYKLKTDEIINITPISLKDSQIFLSSCGLLDIDKNSIPDADVISMSYLQFLVSKVLIEPTAKQQMMNICVLCLGMEHPVILADEKGKPILADIIDNKPKTMITHKEFDEIKRIILYQNLLDYDDEYINPELKQAMHEQDALKNAKWQSPNLERQIGIITAHCGVTKSEQMAMTLREHSILFKEVVGEVDYAAHKAIACFSGKGDEVQWIHQSKKGKFDDYITSVEEYNKSMGGDGNVPVTQL